MRFQTVEQAVDVVPGDLNHFTVKPADLIICDRRIELRAFTIHFGIIFRKTVSPYHVVDAFVQQIGVSRLAFVCGKGVEPLLLQGVVFNLNAFVGVFRPDLVKFLFVANVKSRNRGEHERNRKNDEYNCADSLLFFQYKVKPDLKQCETCPQNERRRNAVFRRFGKRAFVEEDHAVLCDKQHKKRETE